MFKRCLDILLAKTMLPHKLNIRYSGSSDVQDNVYTLPTRLYCLLPYYVRHNHTHTSYTCKVKKKILFVSCNGPKKNRVGRSVKKMFFGQKCVFYACFTLIWSWEGGKNFRVVP